LRCTRDCPAWKEESPIAEAIVNLETAVYDEPARKNPQVTHGMVCLYPLLGAPQSTSEMLS
jgi:hypothetical protein